MRNNIELYSIEVHSILFQVFTKQSRSPSTPSTSKFKRILMSNFCYITHYTIDVRYRFCKCTSLNMTMKSTFLSNYSVKEFSSGFQHENSATVNSEERTGYRHAQIWSNKDILSCDKSSRTTPPICIEGAKCTFDSQFSCAANTVDPCAGRVRHEI